MYYLPLATSQKILADFIKRKDVARYNMSQKVVKNRLKVDWMYAKRLLKNEAKNMQS